MKKILFGIAVVGAFFLSIAWLGVGVVWLGASNAAHTRSVEMARLLKVTPADIERMRDSFRSIGMSDLKIIDIAILEFGSNHERCKRFDHFETIETKGCKGFTEALKTLGVNYRTP
jgi:hypothetical protein